MLDAVDDPPRLLAAFGLANRLLGIIAMALRSFPSSDYRQFLKKCETVFGLGQHGQVAMRIDFTDWMRHNFRFHSLARTVIELVAFVADAWFGTLASDGRPKPAAASLSARLQLLQTGSLYTSVQSEVDALYLRAVVALLQSPGTQLGSLVAMLPFQYLSADGAWRLVTCTQPVTYPLCQSCDSC